MSGKCAQVVGGIGIVATYCCVLWTCIRLVTVEHTLPHLIPGPSDQVSFTFTALPSCVRVANVSQREATEHAILDTIRYNEWHFPPTLSMGCGHRSHTNVSWQPWVKVVIAMMVIAFMTFILALPLLDCCSKKQKRLTRRTRREVVTLHLLRIGVHVLLCVCMALMVGRWKAASITEQCPPNSNSACAERIWREDSVLPSGSCSPHESIHDWSDFNRVAVSDLHNDAAVQLCRFAEQWCEPVQCMDESPGHPYPRMALGYHAAQPLVDHINYIWEQVSYPLWIMLAWLVLHMIVVFRYLTPQQGDVVNDEFKEAILPITAVVVDETLHSVHSDPVGNINFVPPTETDERQSSSFSCSQDFVALMRCVALVVIYACLMRAVHLFSTFSVPVPHLVPSPEDPDPWTYSALSPKCANRTHDDWFTCPWPVVLDQGCEWMDHHGVPLPPWFNVLIAVSFFASLFLFLVFVTDRRCCPQCGRFGGLVSSIYLGMLFVALIYAWQSAPMIERCPAHSTMDPWNKLWPEDRIRNYQEFPTVSQWRELELGCSRDLKDDLAYADAEHDVQGCSDDTIVNQDKDSLEIVREDSTTFAAWPRLQRKYRPSASVLAKFSQTDDDIHILYWIVGASILLQIFLFFVPSQ